MLIVAVNGSPRKDGNTAYLLKAALDEAGAMGAQTAYIQASEVIKEAKIPFCAHCSTPCKGVCYEGTALAEALDLLREADGVILGSPVYFATVSAQLKAFWDKTRRLRKDFALLNVVGGAVVTGGSRFGGQETTVRALHDMMMTQGMTIVGDGHLSGDAGHQGACAQQPARDDSEVDKRMRLLVRRVVEVARATAELRRAARTAAKG
ncbi:flavodoxin family protein [Candidatus Desulforudis audaxviator]|uniref:NADPH-dependent FMN reductase n=1 Tax=Desulforudis audaxviator (strain MP104C) TaxID=477974 RepID=B1I1T8_DESAP|nr:flavodoxin family protein [Candidatus Desulforudis audaxviator]ACA59035.1 NADPH-dependent FMN reductase [Candidatus Desulforudis audaxviator MP104C]AZK59081.1 Iron-sulfur flavoprotein [Candidatus Desulforudis audaxviator]